MPTQLPTTTPTGQINVTLFRIARLDSDCTIVGGNNSGYTTVGLSSITATPEVEEGTDVEPKNGEGTIMFIVPGDDVVKRFNLSGEMWFFDWEAMELMFGGEVLLGAAGGDFAGQTNGYASPNATAAPPNGVYLETITQQVAQDAGDCVTVGGSFAPYVGDIYGKVKLTLGELSREEGAARLTFTGKATSNPNLFDGPWNDSPIAGYLRNSPWQQVGYSAAEYAAILATVRAGYQDLPTGS
jgi:hypothetical protein